MSTTTYISTRASNAASLGAVAYGTSLYFSYVNDQIINSQIFLDLFRSRNSQLFLDSVLRNKNFMEFIAGIFSQSNEVENFIKIAPEVRSATRLAEKWVKTLAIYFDINSAYSLSLRGLFQKANYEIINLQRGSELEENLVNSLYKSEIYKNLYDFYELINLNSRQKIYKIPPESTIELKDTIESTIGWNGLNRELAEIPITDWERGFVYRGVELGVPNNLKFTQFIQENLKSYPVLEQETLEITNGSSVSLAEEVSSEDINTTPFFNFSPRVNQLEFNLLNISLIGAPAGTISLV